MIQIQDAILVHSLISNYDMVFNSIAWEDFVNRAGGINENFSDLVVQLGVSLKSTNLLLTGIKKYFLADLTDCAVSTESSFNAIISHNISTVFARIKADKYYKGRANKQYRNFVKKILDENLPIRYEQSSVYNSVWEQRLWDRLFVADQDTKIYLWKLVSDVLCGVFFAWESFRNAAITNFRLDQRDEMVESIKAMSLQAEMRTLKIVRDGFCHFGGNTCKLIKEIESLRTNFLRVSDNCHSAIQLKVNGDHRILIFKDYLSVFPEDAAYFYLLVEQNIDQLLRESNE